jgi:hypothetical protein
LRFSTLDVRGEEYVKMLEAFAGDPSWVVGGVLVGLRSAARSSPGKDAEFAPCVRRGARSRRFSAARRDGEAERVTALRPDLLGRGDAGGRPY